MDTTVITHTHTQDKLPHTPEDFPHTREDFPHTQDFPAQRIFRTHDAEVGLNPGCGVLGAKSLIKVSKESYFE